ncbi:7-cyano-7-deazaguanine/7-aminomethyl-7-deazaguanine transporter [Ferrimonas balearica]|uniref:7-cyano-7-deazaguanine/7-aminomethyl-7- deazaguanine transporter n=1 Tax=Ferrimonas balearica TaxID=44012 RepID=UPI001C995B19|nr:7-cyano-7-deazaguanine/7-aminomethyl-7-deazaguanine transporter [Ferrimonas balearica]MBY5922751.1 7-cyano-7-deazaguanine/7-aminomethyl-7-deazaguanine transporter [Ferrimonas balearica]MBY5995735.1 7-cyano-7-deazaguanine/7-aminomethyl-7-deazaguanine transporter [Ferrimonas balearica]
MLSLTGAQMKRALAVLVSFHILIIASSNFLVQLPFQLFGYHTTWGAFSFPFVYLATDLTVRIFGAPAARRIIFGAMFPALIISYLVSVIWHNGEFVGLSGLTEFNTFVARIALASFAAYLFGQLMDIKVFAKLRQQAAWFVAPAASTVIGNFVDTAVFFSVAFYASADPFMAEHWVEIATVDYVFKLAISLMLFLPAYGVLLKLLTDRILRQNPQQHPLA